MSDLRVWLLIHLECTVQEHHFTKRGGFAPLNKFNPATFYWSACIKPGKWVVMYICVRVIYFGSFYVFVIRLCSNSMVYYVFVIRLCSNSMVYYVFVIRFCSNSMVYYVFVIRLCSNSMVYYVFAIRFCSNSMVYYVFAIRFCSNSMVYYVFVIMFQ
jgi:hypothetical protein